MADPISDMLQILKNAQAVRKEMVGVPFSQQKYAIAKILEARGFIKNADFTGRRNKRIIEIALRYLNGAPRISGVKRVSKPGQRVYISYDKIKRVRNGEGIGIISTSKGLMSGEDAKKAKVGGELLCQLW